MLYSIFVKFQVELSILILSCQSISLSFTAEWARGFYVKGHNPINVDRFYLKELSSVIY